MIEETVYLPAPSLPQNPCLKVRGKGGWVVAIKLKLPTLAKTLQTKFKHNLPNLGF